LEKSCIFTDQTLRNHKLWSVKTRRYEERRTKRLYEYAYQVAKQELDKGTDRSKALRKIYRNANVSQLFDAWLVGQ
jgi:hypothetical protein